MTRKILLGAVAAFALSAGAALPAMAQDYDSYDTQPDYQYQEDYTMPLRAVDDTDRINNVAVETPSGEFAGQVRSIRTNFQGEPSRVGIALRNGRWVWADAADMRYDPERNIVRSSLSYNELEDMSI